MRIPTAVGPAVAGSLNPSVTCPRVGIGTTGALSDDRVGNGGGDMPPVCGKPNVYNPRADDLLLREFLAKQQYLRTVRRFMHCYMRTAALNAGAGAMAAPTTPYPTVTQTDLYMYVCMYSEQPHQPQYRPYSQHHVPVAHAAQRHPRAPMAVQLVPRLSWCQLQMRYGTSHGDDPHVYMVLTPQSEHCAVVGAMGTSPPPPLPLVSHSFTLPQATAREYYASDIVPLVVVIACEGAVVEVGGKQAGLLFHGVMPEPRGQYEEDAVVVSREYCSSTSDGVYVVMNSTGVGVRTPPPAAAHTVPPPPLSPMGGAPVVTALALHEVHLHMETLFQTRSPPRWPHVLAFLQQCKYKHTKNNSELQSMCTEVMRCYECVKTCTEEIDNRVRSSEHLPNTAYGCAPYTSITCARAPLHQYGGFHGPAGHHAYAPSQAPPPPPTPYAHSRAYYDEEDAVSSKPSCTIC